MTPQTEAIRLLAEAIAAITRGHCAAAWSAAAEATRLLDDLADAKLAAGALEQ